MTTLDIPLSNLRRHHRVMRSELDAAIGAVLDRSDFIRGEALARFERAFADHVGVTRAIGVASGTDALTLALAGAGVGQGDEVITAANSFAATAEAIVMARATPVFADVDDSTLNIDPASVRRAITPATRAIIPVHLHGMPADMDPLLALAKQHGLVVVEDAAQAHGATLDDGRTIGAIGDAGCFSFFPSKNLGAAGDGGAVTTNSPNMAKQIGMIRDHGRSTTRQHEVVGMCSRLDTLQAAVLSVKLPHLDAWNARRRQLARRYLDALSGIDAVRLPPYKDGAVFHHFTLRTEERDRLKRHLNDHGIAAGIHYLRSIPDEPAFVAYRTAPTPVSDASCAQVLSLPLCPDLTDDEADRVIAKVRAFFA